MGSLSTTAEIIPRGRACAVVLTDEQVAVVGEGAKRFPVAATLNGYTWRTSVVRMGGEFLLGLSREVRAAAGVQAGDTAQLRLELDTKPREVEVPEALEAALAADRTARAAYDRLAYTHRKEFARWIAEAKKDETQERRVAQAIAMLHAGRTRS
jgi:hypothetical protein